MKPLYYEYTVKAVDQPYKLQLSVKNMQQLKAELGGVKVYSDEVINIAFYESAGKDTVKHRIKVDDREFNRFMEWIDGKLQELMKRV